MGQGQKDLQETADTTAEKAAGQVIAGQVAEEKTEYKAGEKEDVVVRDKAKRKAVLLAAVGAVLVLLAVVITCVIVFGGSEGRLQDQLDLGAKYLEEMDYEQALVAFNTALEIDPKNADAYLGIVEVYIRTNDFETALEYAKEGYEVTGDERLKEKIDMIESGDIFASNGWCMKMSGYDGDGNLVFWHEYTYNLQGQTASVAKYNAQGVQEQYLEFAYDEEGRRLIDYSYGTLDGNITKWVLEYSGNNYRVTHYEGTSDEVTGYSEVETDADGKELKETRYDSDGTVRGTEVYEYDEDGKLVKREYYDSDNELTGYYIHTYDEEGNRLQQQHYDSNGALTGYTEDIYDAEGNYTGQRDYDADGVLQSEHVNQ